MTMIGKALSLLLVYTLVVGTEAFSPVEKPFATTRPLARNAVALLRADAEDHAAYLMHKAEECAFSDTCSVDDAKSFLREVVHVQSGCAAGTLLGHELCEDQAHVAVIVSHLRAKIEQGVSNSLSVKQQVNGEMALGSLAIIAAVFALSAQSRGQGDAIPFTPQEWWWAMQGGYLDTMIAHFVRNGGL